MLDCNRETKEEETEENVFFYFSECQFRVFPSTMYRIIVFQLISKQSFDFSELKENKTTFFPFSLPINNAT